MFILICTYIAWMYISEKFNSKEENDEIVKDYIEK